LAHAAGFGIAEFRIPEATRLKYQRWHGICPKSVAGGNDGEPRVCQPLGQIGWKMQIQGKATNIRLFNLSTPQMRAFHMTWFAFFLCFFAWFGIAPLMPVVREEMKLTKDQVGWCVIGSVAITVFVRLFIGWLCDRIGPRLAYTGLLLLGSLPVMGIALARDYETFLLCRVLIGAIGASFVITQYHTSIMFAPNCVGTANATAAGWGNLGGGVTQFVMPQLLALFVGVLGFSSFAGWRLSMVVAGAVCALAGVAYFFLTQDAPEGNFAALRARKRMPSRQSARGGFLEACRDRRVWVLAMIYGACFGLELTIDNIAVLYFLDHFEHLKQAPPMQALATSGLVAGLFGGMNLFARALGGIVGDKVGTRWGLAGRTKWLFLALFGEGLLLMCFSQTRTLWLAVLLLMLFGLFVKMSNGATYSVVPFINPRALGSVAGIVGAGGNVGAVAAGFLLKSEAISWPTALFVLGVIVTATSFATFAITFSSQAEADARAAAQSARAPLRPQLDAAAA
jgi:NNP family nitrate/nitrite transporter-like MFS transporter